MVMARKNGMNETHPVLKLTISELLEQVDQSGIQRFMDESGFLPGNKED
jgi:hypothetical protein